MPSCHIYSRSAIFALYDQFLDRFERWDDLRLFHGNLGEVKLILTVCNRYDCGELC